MLAYLAFQYQSTDMTELSGDAGVTFDQFQGHVWRTRFDKEVVDGWRAQSCIYISDEFLEASSQHVALPLVLRGATESLSPLDDGREMLLAVADEIGDLTWFCADVANSGNIDLWRALSYYFHTKGMAEVPTDFGELDSLSGKMGPNVEVPTKLGWGIARKRDLTYFVLEDNPYYVFSRSTSRLLRSLDPYKYAETSAYGPPGATDLEPVADLDYAIAEMLVVMSYISQNFLTQPLSVIVEFNIAKLAHRQEHGKENDISFADWLANRDN